MMNVSCDDSEALCNICTEYFSSKRKAIVAPCGHCLCSICLKKLKPLLCPYCRTLVDIGRCTEDLRLQEIGNLRLAKAMSAAENRPFEWMNCCKCKTTTAFSGLYTCVSCYPEFMNIVIFGQSTQLVEQMAMCCKCVCSHEVTHSEEYPPLLIAYNACIEKDMNMLLPLAKQIFYAQRHAPHQTALIACLMFNTLKYHSIEQFTEDFWNILLRGSIEFLKFVVAVQKIAEIRNAGCLFLTQYIPLLQCVSHMGIEGYPLINRIWNVIPTVIRAIKDLAKIIPGTDHAHLTTMKAWEGVSSILDRIWVGVKNTDRGGFSRVRMDKILEIVKFIKDTFPNLEKAAEAICIIVEDEVGLATLECVTPSAVERFRSYITELQQLKAEAYIPIVQRDIRILRAEQDALYESAR